MVKFTGESHQKRHFDSAKCLFFLNGGSCWARTSDLTNVNRTL